MYHREIRYGTHVQVILSARGFGRYFTVKNVNYSGACLEGNKSLNPDEVVAIDIGGRSINGTVRWAEGRKMGIQFDERLDSHAFNALMKKGPSSKRPN